MKNLPVGLQSSLNGGVTRLCWCWRLTRRDGIRMGFTDHDNDVVFDGTTFEAAAGFTASDINESVGLAVDNLEVTGALSSERLTEADLAAGFYDDAAVEIFRVDWSAPENRILMRSGSLGEVSRSRTGFKAEVRGLAHYLQQPKGRVFQHTCDADLGDGRCKIDLDQGVYMGTGTATEFLSERKFLATGIEVFPSDFFSRGLLKFTSGPALGQELEVKVHLSRDGEVTIECWGPVRQPLTGGSTFEVRAGCDKTFVTCASKFNNTVNFRGFPHIPGNDFVASHARRPGARQ
jgi:uncharacterized phage protein (TIGR02218 family)